MADGFIVMDIQTQGLVDAITGLDRLNADMRDMRSIRDQMEVLTTALITDLIEATPVGETGELAAGWDVEDASVGNYEFSTKIINRSDHAAFVIQGTGIYGPTGHEIVAQNKPFKFTWQGRQFKLRSHSGQTPNIEINQLLDSIPDMSIQASGRALRGAVDVIFNRQGAPFMDVMEAAESHDNRFGYGTSPAAPDAGWIGA
jgi:hypothetical protein